MTEYYGPFDSANMGEDTWTRMARAFTSNGVYTATDLGITSAALTATIAAGEAYINGFWYRTDATINKTISANNAGVGTTRIDRIVVRADPANNQVVTDVLVGTASASPVVPTLTQILGGVWEESLAQVAVANGVTAMTITDERIIAGSLGLYKAYTVTVGASTTAPTKGNSTYLGKYTRMGKRVEVTVTLAIGSTFSAGSGTYRFSLPFLADVTLSSTGAAWVNDSGTGLRVGLARIRANTDFEVYLSNISGAALADTGPGTAWATGDSLQATLTYESA